MATIAGYLAFPIGTILAIFDLQVSLITPTNFQVNWLFNSREKAKKKKKKKIFMEAILDLR